MKKLLIILLLTSNLCALAPTSNVQLNLKEFLLNTKDYTKTKMLHKYKKIDMVPRNQIMYMNTKERQIYLVDGKDGKLFYPFFKENLNGEFKFAVDKELNMYAHTVTSRHIAHSSFLCGDEVISAGLLIVHSGILKAAVSYTGHYAIKYKNFLQVLDVFKILNIDIEKVLLKNHKHELKSTLIRIDNTTILTAPFNVHIGDEVSKREQIAFYKAFNSIEFYKILHRQNLLKNEIKRYYIERIGSGVEKTVFKLSIIYKNETEKILKIAKFHKHSPYINIQRIMNHFEDVYLKLKSFGLFKNGVLAPYFAQLKGKNIFIGEFVKEEKKHTSYFEFVAARLVIQIFFSSLNNKLEGFFYSDVHHSNYVHTGGNGFSIQDSFTIIDYPLTFSGQISWKLLTFDQFFDNKVPCINSQIFTEIFKTVVKRYTLIKATVIILKTILKVKKYLRHPLLSIAYSYNEFKPVVNMVRSA